MADVQQSYTVRLHAGIGDIEVGVEHIWNDLEVGVLKTVLAVHLFDGHAEREKQIDVSHLPFQTRPFQPEQGTFVKFPLERWGDPDLAPVDERVCVQRGDGGRIQLFRKAAHCRVQMHVVRVEQVAVGINGPEFAVRYLIRKRVRILGKISQTVDSNATDRLLCLTVKEYTVTSAILRSVSCSASSRALISPPPACVGG